MKKVLFILIGIICVILGVIGIFLPILPTTPFLLLASLLFLNSSEKLHKYLNNHKYFGEYIRDYHEKRGVKRAMKVRAIVFIWVSILFSAYMINILWVSIVLIVIAVCVTAYLVSLKTL